MQLLITFQNEILFKGTNLKLSKYTLISKYSSILAVLHKVNITHDSKVKSTFQEPLLDILSDFYSLFILTYLCLLKQEPSPANGHKYVCYEQNPDYKAGQKKKGDSIFYAPSIFLDTGCGKVAKYNLLCLYDAVMTSR